MSSHRYRRHPERHVAVHGAELAFVVRAALRDLQQWKGGPVRIAINGSCKMHIITPQIFRRAPDDLLTGVDRLDKACDVANGIHARVGVAFFTVTLGGYYAVGVLQSRL